MFVRSGLPISGQANSRESAPNKEKRTLPGIDAGVSEFGCVTALGPEGPISTARFGNINPIPFRSTRGKTCAEARARAPSPTSLSVTAWCFQTSVGGRANATRPAASSPQFRTELSDLSGPTDPCPTAVHMEPFSTSVYKVFICILVTITKICIEGGSTRAHAQRFNATDAPSYSSGPGISHALSRRCGMGRTLQRHPFSGLVDSAGELLHTP